MFSLFMRLVGFGVIASLFCLAPFLTIGSANELNPSLSLSFKKSEKFSDLYSEQIALSRVSTLATFNQLRLGWKQSGYWEVYGAVRFGADSRTILEKSELVYNDNYLFIGAGVDYLGWIPGFRWVMQLGISQDITYKTQLSGLDTRLGLITFHEIKQSNSSFYSEIYSENLYIGRYKNFLSSLQLRGFYQLLKFDKFELAPLVSLVGQADTQGLDFNRFAELRTGLSIKWRTSYDLILMPYYAIGSRWSRPTSMPQYQEFRALVALSSNI